MKGPSHSIQGIVEGDNERIALSGDLVPAVPRVTGGGGYRGYRGYNRP